MKTGEERVKREHMSMLADWREKKYVSPELRQMFLELTQRCNEHCIHCGSRCGKTEATAELTVHQYYDFLSDIASNFDTGKMQVNITGGEPMIRKDFFDIMSIINDLGFRWGMTSNGTLITEKTLPGLIETGMKTISVSLDGLKESHDTFRQIPGLWDKTMRGIHLLVDAKAFSNVQITTVVHHKNVYELPKLLEILNQIDIDSWRIINMEPIGRAQEHPEMMMTPKDYRYMFDFIRMCRHSGLPVSYGCSHFLGVDYEREVRNWYFLCNAGIYVAGITYSGDICSCLDIERRPETIVGNILTDDFKTVWDTKFGFFRRDRSKDSEKCRSCPDKKFCAGDAMHSWDFDSNSPRLCMRNILR